MGLWQLRGCRYHKSRTASVLEIYYERPDALQLYTHGRSDEDEALPVTGVGAPLPQWLREDWPGPEMKAKIEGLQRQKGRATA
jgi:hypothetical protein